jgi:colanic acid/amylovoran biosynthesis glycosyltransferase
MSECLAIFTPGFGHRSETFITRHIDELLPGQSVVVTRHLTESAEGGMVPSLVLDRLPQERIRTLVGRLLMQKAGWSVEEPEVSAVTRFLKKHRVTVVMGEYLDAFLPWLPVCRRLGIRTYCHAHGYDIAMRLREDKWRQAYLQYREADGIITVNRVQRQRLVELGLDANRIHVIPCGVDVPPVSVRRPEEGIIRCLCVGRMVAKKAPILCLDAFRRASSVVPELRLDYVGGGGLISAARQFVKALDLGEKVTLHGEVDHHTVHRLMANADIFMMHCMTDPETGDEEGLPVAILEAMANGLPVVSTLHAGIPEAVEHELTGLLCAEGDNEGMAENLVVLARNNEKRLRMGAAGRERIITRFSGAMERSQLLDAMKIAQ